MPDGDTIYDRVYREKLAPVLIDYCEWVMRSVSEAGYPCVYFLARDMYPVYHAALHMYERQDGLPKPIYLSVSRLALRNAEETGDVSARRYLRQEGIWTDMQIAIADSGWIGTIQRSIERVSGAHITGFYAGLYAIPDDMEPGAYRTYLFGPGDGMDRKLRFSNSLYECMSSAPYGMTTGYMCGSDGRYEPVLSDLGNPNSDRMERNLAVLMELLETDTGCGAMSADDAARERHIEDMLSFMSDPTYEEAESLGRQLFCYDVSEEEMNEVAVRWNEYELSQQWLLPRVLCRLRGGMIAESPWPEGSAVRSLGEGERAHRLSEDIRRYRYLSNMRKYIRYKWMVLRAAGTGKK